MARRLDADDRCPLRDGLNMPAEWEPHAGCLMQWPSRPDLWHERLGAAKQEYAVVAGAIARCEPNGLLDTSTDQ